MAESPGQLSSLALVSIGGSLGAALRYAVSLFAASVPSSFPWATFSVNVVGCTLAGILIALIGFDPSGAAPGEYLRLLLLVGVLGGFTTYSAFSVEILALISSGAPYKALVYVVATNLASLVSAGIAFVVVSRM